MSVIGSILSSIKIRVELPTSSPLECELIWRQGLRRGDQDKVSRIASFNVTSIIKKGNWDTETDTHRGKQYQEMGEFQVKTGGHGNYTTSQGIPGARKAWKRQGKSSTYRVQRES